MGSPRLTCRLLCIFRSPVFLGGLLFLLCSTANAQHTLSSAEWQKDLDVLVSTLRSNHPNLFHRVSEQTFAMAVTKARSEIEYAQSDIERYFALRRLVAVIQDGHTQLLEQGIFELTDLRFPFRVDKFSDGFYITVIAEEQENYLGARLEAVNGIPIDRVFETLLKITNVDTPYGKIRPALSGLVFGRILRGVGITEDPERIDLTLLKSDGSRRILTMRAVVDRNPIQWSNRLNQGPTKGEFVHPGTMLGERTPLHLRHQAQNFETYWFEHLEEEKAIYFQLNQVGNDPGGESFQQFSDRFWKYMDDHESQIDRLVIDLRYNDGGVARLAIPFVNEIIKRDRINTRERLFILTGRRTYSAAVIIMTELVVHTEAVFVGEPAASPFNFFSDAVIVDRLPHSRFQILVASRQVDNSWSDDRDAFPPDVRTYFSSADYFSGRDPALETALSITEQELDS